MVHSSKDFNEFFVNIVPNLGININHNKEV